MSPQAEEILTRLFSGEFDEMTCAEFKEHVGNTLGEEVNLEIQGFFLDDVTLQSLGTSNP